jgi:hypothetical protein
VLLDSTEIRMSQPLAALDDELVAPDDDDQPDGHVRLRRHAQVSHTARVRNYACRGAGIHNHGNRPEGSRMAELRAPAVRRPGYFFAVQTPAAIREGAGAAGVVFARPRARRYRLDWS